MTPFFIEQYSPQWYDVRRGVPTASNFKRIITPKEQSYSSQAYGYIAELCGDMLRLDYGKEEPGMSTYYMNRGLKFEAESRHWYEFQHNLDTQKVGFCLSDCKRFGCSPDSLIGEEGVLELKNPAHDTHMNWLIKGELPPEHKAQVHGQILVTGRKWADFLSYYPGCPPFLIRVYPDEFTLNLKRCLDKFWDHYQTTLQKVRGMK